MRLSPQALSSLVLSLQRLGELPICIAQGQRIQDPSAKPELLLIVKGTVRYLDSTSTFGSYTIGLVSSPLIAGWASLLDSPYREECLASTDCEAFSLESLRYDPDIRSILRDTLQDTLLLPEYVWIADHLASISSESKDRLHQLERLQEECCIWRSGTSERDGLPEPHLFFADKPTRGFVYGQAISAATLETQWPNSNEWPRIIAWKSYGWPQENRRLPALEALPFYNNVDESSSPIIQAESIGGGVDSGSSSVNTNSHHLAYDWNRARRPDESHACILSSLLSHFKVPIRRDVIRNAGSFLASSKTGATLESYLNVIEELGLDGRILHFQISQCSRLPVPCLYLDQHQQPILIIEASSKGLRWLHPFDGFGHLPSSHVPEWFDDLDRVLQISPGRHTPQETFGLAWLLPYVSRYKLQLAEVFVASFLTQIFALATPLLFQQIIDRVIGQGSHDSLTGLATLMVIFSLLELTFSSLRTFQFSDISNRIDISLGSTIVSRMLRLNVRYFEKRTVGELSSRLNELDNIRRFLTGTALTVVLDVIFATLYIGVMFFYSVSLTLVILATVPLLVLATVGLTPITQRLLRSRAEAYSRSQSLMVELLNGIQTVKVQNSQAAARRNWEERQLETINKGFKTVLANTASSNVLQLINKISGILIIAIGSWLVIQNQLTLGELIAFRIISGYVTQPLLRLASTYQNFQETSLSVERLSDLVNQPLETGVYEQTNLPMPALIGKLEFQSVSFSYSQASQPQLSGICVDIPAGSFTGLVGQSGCGKSTLLKLLPRLYSPTSGKILLDDLDISKVDLYSLRSQLGFVPQDCLLFEGSVYSNIVVSNPEAETDHVVRSARLACAHDFIMNLPYGYSTPVGEKGAGLSGGQRQRIALARMLLQDPNLIILDEATSALDADTERQVVDNIRKETFGKTMLMITHRISTLQQADQIIVMHNGRVDCVGCHEELMALGGRYFVLYQQQFGGATA